MPSRGIYKVSLLSKGIINRLLLNNFFVNFLSKNILAIYTFRFICGGVPSNNFVVAAVLQLAAPKMMAFPGDSFL